VAAERAARILVVDDDQAVRALVAEVLAEVGYTITVAIHGAQALERISSAAPDLVLSDIMMPVMGGLELCRRITATSRIPVILMSSAPPQEAATSGAVLVVAKPIDLDALAVTVERVLRSRPHA
jgi:CheY-like chemotaxis protein